MTPDHLTTSDPADTSRPAFTFLLYLTPSTLPLAPAQRVVVLNDPDRLQDLVSLYPGAAFWGRAAFWNFVKSLRQELPAAARASAGAQVDAPARAATETAPDPDPGPGVLPGLDFDTPQEAPQGDPGPVPAALELEHAQASNRLVLASINNLKIEFGPAAVALITGDPLDWFRRIGAVLPRALGEAERPGLATSEGRAPSG